MRQVKKKKKKRISDKQRSGSPAFNRSSDAHIIQHSPEPSNLLLARNANPFSDGGEGALPKGQIEHNPYTHK